MADGEAKGYAAVRREWCSMNRKEMPLLFSPEGELKGTKLDERSAAIETKRALQKLQINRCTSYKPTATQAKNQPFHKLKIDYFLKPNAIRIV